MNWLLNINDGNTKCLLSKTLQTEQLISFELLLAKCGGSNILSQICNVFVIIFILIVFLNIDYILKNNIFLLSNIITECKHITMETLSYSTKTILGGIMQPTSQPTIFKRNEQSIGWIDGFGQRGTNEINKYLNDEYGMDLNTQIFIKYMMMLS